ncbi:glycosyltransferase family 4 protein [Lichenifustis flavocetrariae]|uniref:Glycosyltransferase family 4 protein n=1 Tax=Lichenifustis flavocetrariae TaxID=2949735 RepID=A0AA41YZI1_9HYPH|nr:glycosyltransferase family 4 protein [Lichenifustis flavocetrariae]MCW6511429.1 glycosyltransferase family 4 protein [Lichenifustis flavocetrariae]
MQFALTYAPAVFDTRTRMMGRQAAGEGFLRAALAAGPERIWCYARTRAEAEAFGRDARRLHPHPPEIRFISWGQPARLLQAGTLFRPDPGLADDAWRRQRAAEARSWSICGITHTLSSKAAMDCVPALVRAPLQSWDALICTSTAARDVLRHGLEAEIEYLRSRFGAAHIPMPQFPLIPLGVHPEAFAFPPGTRDAARAHLGLAESDVAVLFAGRLSFHVKAHPAPMFLALEAAASRSHVPLHLILFGLFPSEPVAAAFREEAAQLAPSVRLHVLDGRSDIDRDRAWSAADIFTSLADNLQETFGLTPVEAMAAGLPVVVSDWDGYRDTVRNGIDGFRVPTLMAPPGTGEDIADQYEADSIDYDRYVGSACLLTAVDVEAATDAYAKLIESPDLRRQMGEAGRRRAKTTYDWSLVFRRYVALWDELAERRRADVATPGERIRARRPERPDPFTLFRTYPTAVLRDESQISLIGQLGPRDAMMRRDLKSVAFAQSLLPSDRLVHDLFSQLAHEGTATLVKLRVSLPNHTPASVLRAVLLLAKIGVLRVVP